MADTLTPPGAARPRLDSIDVVRGAVMVLMMLDHMRDFTHEGGFTSDPLDLATTTPLLYFTRWITHLCAPTFVFLAGLGAGCSGCAASRSRSSRTSSGRAGSGSCSWSSRWCAGLVAFSFNPIELAQLQVIWVIGVGMIALAGSGAAAFAGRCSGSAR